MACEGTNVFFIPYRPQSKSKKPSADHAPGISQQKHAAREYHRKAKLDRLTKQNARHPHHGRSASVPVSHSQSEPSSRLLIARSKSVPGDEEYDESLVIARAGTGQLDPFNACVPSGVPAYALDILDYGEPFKELRFFFPASI
jgi:hypothetical protein